MSSHHLRGSLAAARVDVLVSVAAIERQSMRAALKTWSDSSTDCCAAWYESLGPSVLSCVHPGRASWWWWICDLYCVKVWYCKDGLVGSEQDDCSCQYCLFPVMMKMAWDFPKRLQKRGRLYRWPYPSFAYCWDHENDDCVYWSYCELEE